MRGQEVQFSKEGQHSPIGSMSGAEGDLEIRDRKWEESRVLSKNRQLVRMEPRHGEVLTRVNSARHHRLEEMRRTK